MDFPAIPGRVVLDITPHLLADTLTRLLTDAGVDVVRQADVEVAPSVGAPVAVVTTASAPVATTAQVVVELGSSPAGRASARVTETTGSLVVEVEGLEAIIDCVRRLAARPAPRDTNPGA